MRGPCNQPSPPGLRMHLPHAPEPKLEGGSGHSNNPPPLSPAWTHAEPPPWSHSDPGWKEGPASLPQRQASLSLGSWCHMPATRLWAPSSPTTRHSFGCHLSMLMVSFVAVHPLSTCVLCSHHAALGAPAPPCWPTSRIAAWLAVLPCQPLATSVFPREGTWSRLCPRGSLTRHGLLSLYKATLPSTPL